MSTDTSGKPRGHGAPAGGRREPDQQPAAGADHSQHERKEQVLTQSSASIVRSISDAVVAKDGEPFFLCPPDGQLQLDQRHGYGFYHHDCRFLGGYRLRLAGTEPGSLAASEAAGTELVLELVNSSEIKAANGPTITKEQIALTWTRKVDADGPALHEEIRVRNFGREKVELPLELEFRADFEDVFQIRGLLAEQAGTKHGPRWDGDRLNFSYSGGDGIDRRVGITFEPKPAARMATGVRFDLALDGRGDELLKITLELDEKARSGVPDVKQRAAKPSRGREQASSSESGEPSDWLGDGEWPTAMRTSSVALGMAMRRSLADLQMLRGRLDGHAYYEAGLPWFATLFGRDSLISALQTTWLDPSVTADTLRVLASRQGTKVDHWRDEAPGKILHELRVGELARLNEIPQTPYYGSIDSTPLFLIALAEHARWTGTLDLFDELRDSVERALAWIDDYSDTDGDGFADYNSNTKRGLVNQGWKDSGDAIVTDDGQIASPPIALPEVQGYIFRAWRGTAGLLERAGDQDAAAKLTQRADTLRHAFEDRFWDDRLSVYVLALANGKPCRVVSSNAGQVLWGGICSEDRARRVAQRLLKRDMFAGWGIRTLSADAAAYHPIGYHLGTIWPHDNSLVAAGFRRYGADDAAETLLISMIEAAQDFPHARLPECFAGYDRSEFGAPVRYPVACHPQAWAAGSVPYLLATALGLEPDGFGHQLNLVRPRLPGFIDNVELRGLAVGEATADLRFYRAGNETRVDVLHLDGKLDVSVVADGTG